MITSTDYWRQLAPEIGNRTIEDCPDWHLLKDPMRWGALDILDDYRGNIRILAFLVTLLA